MPVARPVVPARLAKGIQEGAELRLGAQMSPVAVAAGQRPLELLLQAVKREREVQDIPVRFLEALLRMAAVVVAGQMRLLPSE
jgi:hypothetical protein